MNDKLEEAIEKLKWLGEQISPSPIKEAIDTRVAELEKPTYTAEDMQGFAEWCNTKGWYYISGDKKWFYEFTKKDRSIGYKYKSTTQLLKMWEEQK